MLFPFPPLLKAFLLLMNFSNCTQAETCLNSTENHHPKWTPGIDLCVIWEIQDSINWVTRSSDLWSAWSEHGRWEFHSSVLNTKGLLTFILFSLSPPWIIPLKEKHSVPIITYHAYDLIQQTPLFLTMAIPLFINPQAQPIRKHCLLLIKKKTNLCKGNWAPDFLKCPAPTRYTLSSLS